MTIKTETAKTINVGEKYFFKTAKTRGRPFVGEVVKKAGMFTMIQNKDGDVVRVKTYLIGRPYVFTPYQTKKRREALEG